MAEPKTREQVLEDALRDLIRNFRQTVASGRSRIVEESGGDETACDSVEQMLARNPYLRNAEKALAYGVTVAPKREAPPGKWKVDMPDGTYGTMPGDPPGPASVRTVIGGYVYDVEPQTGRLLAASPPRGVSGTGHQTISSHTPMEDPNAKS